MDLGIKLTTTEGEKVTSPSLYRRMIGCLMYLTILSPDITYAVTKLSRYMSDPRIPYRQALHHLLHFIKSSLGQGLLFSTQSLLRLSAFSDVDWGSCLDTRCSTSVFFVFLGDSLISWKCKQQPTVSQSSAEAEYCSLAGLSSELIWLNNFL